MILANFWQSVWDAIKNFFISVGEFFVAQDEKNLTMLTRIILAILVLVLGVLVIKLLILVIKRASGIKRGIAADLSAKSFFIEAFKILLYIVLAFMVIGILGINITGAVGIISAITVALGLALQDIIGMFASGVLIFNVKNIKTGDYIKVVNSFGQEEGKVFRISLLYTTLLNYNGQKIHIPNNNITKANVTNYAQYDSRRGIISVIVTYQSDSQLVIDTLKEAALSQEKVLKDPAASAVVADFKEFGVQYDLRFHTKLDDYWDTLFALRIKVLDALKEKGIEVATSTNLTIKK